jgi:hypothetical protein
MISLRRRPLSATSAGAAVHPRRTLDPAQNAAQAEARRQSIAEAIDAETRWLDGGHPEPPWPAIAPWHSRRRRGIRLDPRIPDEDRPQRPAAPPEMYVDEQALAILPGLGLRIQSATDSSLFSDIYIYLRGLAAFLHLK